MPRPMNIVLDGNRTVQIDLDKVPPDLMARANTQGGWGYIARVMEEMEREAQAKERAKKAVPPSVKEAPEQEDAIVDEVAEDTKGLSADLRLERTIYRLRQEVKAQRQTIQQLQKELEQEQAKLSSLLKEAKLSFLTDPPRRPNLRVVFDLGKAGRHSKSFHAISRNGIFLSLIYDDRYEGDRFIPAPTEPGETITVTLPAYLDEVTGEALPPTTIRAAVPGFEQVIGCLDIVNLLVVEDVPSAEETNSYRYPEEDEHGDGKTW